MSAMARLEAAFDAWVEQHGMIWFSGDLDLAHAIADHLGIELQFDGDPGCPPPESSR